MVMGIPATQAARSRNVGGVGVGTRSRRRMTGVRGVQDGGERATRADSDTPEDLRTSARQDRGLRRLAPILLILLALPVAAGAYAGDTHYYVRFASALLAGFEWDEAHLIASADLMIDRNRATHAEKNPTRTHNKLNWHAFERDEARFLELWERVLAEPDPELQLIELGQFLHFAADWEPHGVFGARMGHGAATVVGRDPDSLGANVMNNRRMIRQTVELMVRFRAATGRDADVDPRDVDRRFVELYTEHYDDTTMDELYMLNTPRWKTWGIRGRKGKKILARNHLLVEQMIAGWGRRFPEMKVPSDFTPGDPEKGLPPPITMTYRKDGDLLAVYGVEIELYPEFEGSELGAALEERYEERVEPAVAKQLQEELHAGADSDLFSVVAAEVIDADLKKNGWRITVEVTNFGVGYSGENRLLVEVVEVGTEALVGHTEHPLPPLKGGQRERLRILVPSEGQPGRDVAVGVTLDGSDLLADDNDDWFVPWAGEVEGLAASGKPERRTRGRDTVVLAVPPRVWLEGDEAVVVVLSALASGGDTSHRLREPVLALDGEQGRVPLDTGALEGVVWSASVDLETRTMPARTFIWIPLVRLCADLGAARLAPERLEVSIGGDQLETLTGTWPLAPELMADLGRACGTIGGPAGGHLGEGGGS